MGVGVGVGVGGEREKCSVPSVKAMKLSLIMSQSKERIKYKTAHHVLLLFPSSLLRLLDPSPPLQREEERRSAKAESQQVHLADIHSYVTHIKLTHSIRRTLLLVRSMQQGQKKGRPEEFVRLYDSLLQVPCVEGKGGVGEWRCGCIMSYKHSMYVKGICGRVFLSLSQH